MYYFMMNFVVILVGKGGTREEPAACTFKKVVQVRHK